MGMRSGPFFGGLWWSTPQSASGEALPPAECSTPYPYPSPPRLCSSFVSVHLNGCIRYGFLDALRGDQSAHDSRPCERRCVTLTEQGRPLRKT